MSLSSIRPSTEYVIANTNELTNEHNKTCLMLYVRERESLDQMWIEEEPSADFALQDLIVLGDKTRSL